MKAKIDHFYTSLTKDNTQNLKVIYAKDDSTALLSLQLFVRTGSAFEQENEKGYSHFLEHLVFKSTENYPNNSIMNKAAECGAVINAFTEYEFTCFYINTPSEYLDIGLHMLSEIVHKANFSKNDFECEKKVVLEELKQYQNDPEESFVENIPVLIEKNSPYAKLIIGNKESLGKAKIHDLLGFYKKTYHPANVFLCVAGDFEIESLKTSVDFFFRDFVIKNTVVSHFSSTPKPSILQDSNNQTSVLKQNSHHQYLPKSIAEKINILYHKKKITNDMIAFVIPELSDNNPYSHAMALLSKAFAMGNNSRLYQRLYLKDKLVDNIRVHSISGVFDGFMIILVYPREHESLESIVKSFMDEYLSLFRFGLSFDEMQKVKTELVNSSEYVYEYMEGLAQSLGYEEILGDYNTFFEYEKNILQVSHADIMQMLSENYTIEKLYIIKAGKEENLKISEIVLEEQISKEEKLSIKKKKGKPHETALPSSFEQRTENLGDILHYPLPERSDSVNTIYENRQIKLCQLPNGLKVFLKKAPQKTICGVSLALRVSQLDENEFTMGTNHLTTSFMLHGNKKRDYKACIDFCSCNGIHFSTSCGKETTKFKLKCFKENLYPALMFLHDVLSTPTFPISQYKNLTETFISNINRRKDYPHSEAVHLWKEMIFGKQSNLVSKDGLVKVFKNISRKKIGYWYSNKIASAPAALCIIGDIDFADTLYWIENIFAENFFSENLSDRAILLSPSKKKQIVVEKGIEQSIINLGGFCMTGKEIKYRAPMNILAQIIGGDINSRMSDLLREQLGIAYSTEFDFELLNDIGFFNMFTIVDKKKEELAINSLVKIQTEIKNKGVKKDEIQRAKNYLIGQLRMDEESFLSQAQMISALLALGNDYNIYEQREKRILDANNDFILEIANKYFDMNKQFLHIMH